MILQYYVDTVSNTCYKLLNRIYNWIANELYESTAILCLYNTKYLL